MAKKKQETKKKQIKKVSNKIICKCGKEWDRKDVENDSTVHKIDSYQYKFLRTYKTLSTGFNILEKLNVCPDCRNQK